VTFGEAWTFVSQSGSPVLVGAFLVFVLLQLFSERVAKALGPILGAVGRWWHGREQRQEEQLQAELRAREATVGQRAAYQLDDMDQQLRYFAEQVKLLREENAQLRVELKTVHHLLDAQTRKLNVIDHKLDTGERLAVIPPPPVAGRHHRPHAEPDADATRRIT
jgi:TolA-binding protein